VPGDRVIEHGADVLSREQGLDWGGYTANPATWKAVQSHAETKQQTITVDLFASSRNNKCPRSYSFHHTHGSESADAFDMASWASSQSPCGVIHQKYTYVFPPSELPLPTWCLLQRDKAAPLALQS